MSRLTSGTIALAPVNSQGTAIAKIVLHIDHDQRLVGHRHSFYYSPVSHSKACSALEGRDP